MGMYTELIFGVKLKKDTPENVINTLKYMTGLISEIPKDYQWEIHKRNPLLGGSYYFAISNPSPNMSFDKISNEWQVNTRGNIKNYENEIEDFLKWIKPFISQGSGYKEMYAITIYEEANEPTIYYLND